jgi:hypothetical protein
MEYTIKFKQEHLAILSQGLGKLPFEVVAPLISEIQKQITEQDKIVQTDTSTQ